MKKILVAITGASGVELGLQTYENIPKTFQRHLIVTENSNITLEKECGKVFTENEFWEKPASGSYGMDAMIIAPCSMNTLAKISVGISDNLVTRAASVMLKERKKLIIAPREMPFDTIALENMLKLSRLGVIIAPPILGYYAQSETKEDIENFIVGKWLDLLEVDHNLYQRWEG